MSKLSQPCPECSFRESSPLEYDEDAQEALSDGCAPSCHSLGAMSSIFMETAPTENRCLGY